jgi:hypothetical protein
MIVKRTGSSLLGLAGLFSTVLFAQKLKTDYDRSADFSRYKTYSWENIQTQHPLWIDRIKAAVDSTLAMKGWTLVQSGGDVSIVAMEITEDHRTLTTYYDTLERGLGWLWRGWLEDGFGTSTTREDTYRVGTLVVDLFDTKTKKLIWRGSGSDTLSNRSDRNIKKLNKGVQKLFEQFPPDRRKAQAQQKNQYETESVVRTETGAVRSDRLATSGCPWSGAPSNCSATCRA